MNLIIHKKNRIKENKLLELKDCKRKDGIIYIYGLFSEMENGYPKIRYVGKAVDPKRRLSSHINAPLRQLNNSLPIYNWVRKLHKSGKEPQMHILDIADRKIGDNWEEVETDWIYFYRKYSGEMLNVANGGEGGQAGISQNQGLKNGRSKLMEADIITIRNRASTGDSYIDIAKDFNVKPSTVSGIAIGKTWGHIGGPIVGKRNIIFRHSLTKSEVLLAQKLLLEGKKSKEVAVLLNVDRQLISPIRSRIVGDGKRSGILNPKMALEIKELLLSGVTPKEIASQFNISHSAVCRIRKGDTWNDIGVKEIFYNAPKVFLKEEILDIKFRLNNGEDYKSIAAEYKVGNRTIRDIKHGNTWKDIGGPVICVNRRIKLTLAKIKEIELCLSNGDNREEAAKKCNVGRSTVQRIMQGDTEIQKRQKLESN